MLLTRIPWETAGEVGWEAEADVLAALPREEAALDPADWSALRALGHRMLDDMCDHVEEVRQRPVWRPMPAEVPARLGGSAPMAPEGAEAAYADFVRDVLPYSLGNAHPRFSGWLVGAGNPLGMLGDMLASGMNPNVAGGVHAANLVERQVLAWCKTLLGIPDGASGVLVSGTSLATMIGLMVGCIDRAEADVRREGIGAAPRPMTLYASTETHGSVMRAVEMLGLGSEALRLIPCDGEFRVDVAALERAIATDRANGAFPFCVVGNAGTTNTGAIDDLTALADLCAAQKLWFHVDGAYGAFAVLSPALRPLLAGMDRADSLALDFHKWLNQPFGIGGVLVRDAAAHRRAFAVDPEYLEHAERGPAGGQHWFFEYGPEFSRPFRALAVWLSFKAHGVATFARLIEQNVAHARRLAELVESAPDLELLAPVSLSTVCFRFVGADRDAAALDRLNRELLLRLQEGGRVLPSGTTITGKFALRAAIINHRTRREDIDMLVAEVRREGQTLLTG